MDILKFSSSWTEEDMIICTVELTQLSKDLFQWLG